MGTPGDKAKIRKVVQGSQLDPEHRDVIVPPPTTAASAAAPPPSTSSAPIQQQPSTSTTGEMGVLSRLPQFDTFSALNVHPSSSSKPESFQQAHIEDYFAQSKYYPGVSENLQALYHQHHQVAPSKPKTFLSVSEPGPSGLQAQQKAKKLASSGVGVTVKRTKKASTTSQPSSSQQQHQKKGGGGGSSHHHSCPVCQKSFATADKLAKHQQVHSGSSPFKCEHCKKSFSSKFKLVRHVLIHSDRKPFSCTVCERTFHRKDHLKNHIKVHSPSKKVYACEKAECKKKYTSLMSYRKHQALHAAEEGSLQCQICSSEFATKDEILYHLKVHAGSRTVKNPNEKKFTCEHCDRKFFTKKDVRRHLVVHTGMRDFLCQFCPQRFGRKDHLVRHIKKSHSKNVPPEDLETDIKTEAPEATDVRSLVVKPDPDVKTEFTQPQDEFSLSFEEVSSILEEESFDTLTPFLGPETFATQEDLGSGFLEDIGGTAGEEDEIIAENVLSNPEIQRLLEPSEEKNLPLPGFSQTFQPPPPP